MTICFAIMLALNSVLPAPLLDMINIFLSMAAVLFASTPAISFIAIWNLEKGTRKIRLEAARSLGNLGRAEGVPALLRASQNSDFLQKVGREAIVRTLPSLTFKKHYGALESDVVPNLCRLLKGSSSIEECAVEEWQWRLLDALEAVGDARAIAPISDLIWEIAGMTTESLVVPEKAESVLEVLKERAARETDQKTLLRGVEAPVLPETLLRSYEGTLQTPPEQLLRAAENEEV